MAKTIVVIGGAHGGPTAAARARQYNEDARIILLEKAADVSWVQAGLRHHLAGTVRNVSEMGAERATFFEKRYKIDVRTETEATALDLDARAVVVRGPSGTERIGFDSVVFAGGAYAVNPKIPGLELPSERVTFFRNLNDLRRLRAAIDTGAKSAVVLGCGPYGVEAAEGLRAAGLSVTVIEKAKRILPNLSLQAARAAGRFMEEAGITLRLGARVTKAEAGDGCHALTLDDGETVTADVIVVCVGMKPRTALLARAGASLNSDGSVRVDSGMKTTLPNIYACGSAVSVPHAVTKSRVWLPQPAIAERTAQIAGRNAALGKDGRSEAMSEVAGTALMQVGDGWVGRTGLSSGEARAHFGADNVVVVTVHSFSTEAWLKGYPLSIRLVVDGASDRVVGAEVWGKQGVARRVDMLAVAVSQGWPTSRLADVDMGYAPSLGPSHDGVATAGSLADMTLAKEARPLAPDVLAVRLARGQDMALIDVSREAREAGFWPDGTLHIPLEELRTRIGEVPSDKPLVFLSHTGRRAHLAARVFIERGVEAVEHLDGGAITWSLMKEA